MNILHIVHNYFPSVGGSQLVFQKLSEGFVARYHDDVVVLTTNAMRSPGFLQNELLAPGEEVVNGVRVQRLPFWRGQLPVMKRVMRVARRLPGPVADYVEPVVLGPLSPDLWRSVRRSSADVIARMAFPYMQMYYPARDIPEVLFGALHIREDHVSRAVLRAIASAEAYVAFTAFERDVLVRKGIDGSRIHVVGLGVDIERYANADGKLIRARHRIGDAPVVAFVGRQAPHKGCDTLLRAMTTVWDRIPDAYLLLAGVRTEHSAQLERMVAELPPRRRERVILAYDVSETEKPAWFAACDVFVTVSSDESFGIVFVEAWACGKPVIGGAIPSVESVIDHGEDGMLVPCGDVPALAASITQVLGDPALGRRMGEAGLRKVRANHDWNGVVDKVHAIYENLA